MTKPTPGEARTERAALAAAAESGERVEVSDYRSETTQVFADPDGNLTLEATAVLGGRSQFFDRVKTDDLISRASSSTPAQNAKGDWVYQVNYGSPVGVDRSTGLPTDFFTLVTNRNGHLVSAYPGLM